MLVVVASIAAISCADDGDDRAEHSPPAPGTSARAVEVETVAVRAEPCDELTPSHGVGTRVSSDLVLTAGHVVDGAVRGVWIDDDPATVVAVDDRLDLALVRAPGAWRPDAVFAGDPSGATAMVTDEDRVATEVVRTVRLTVVNHSDDTEFHRRSHVIDTAVAVGTSGAPVVDETGAIVGVVVLSSRRSEAAYATAGDEVATFVGAVEPDASTQSAACGD